MLVKSSPDHPHEGTLPVESLSEAMTTVKRT